MTYREILEVLLSLNNEELDCTATVYNSQNEEYYPVDCTEKTTEMDVLDADHLVIVFNKTEKEEK